MPKEGPVTNQLGSLTISIVAGDQSQITDPVGGWIEIPNVVLKKKRRFIPNPKHKPCKQHKLQRDCEEKHKAWSTTEEWWAMIAESLFPLLSTGKTVIKEVW